VQLNRHLFAGEVVCVPFSFGQQMSDLREALRSHPSVAVQALLSTSALPIDLIIGADIAYDVSLLAPLAHSLSSIMHSSPCLSYLVETGQDSRHSPTPLMTLRQFAGGTSTAGTWRA
jgi:hypothetical protein